MTEILAKLMQNQILLLSVAVASGLLLGQLKFRSISLGTSGVLFTGLAMGLMNVKISYELFNWNLMLFVVAVGLLSAEDIVLVVKKYGMKFVVLGFVVTAVGALVTYVMARMAVGVDPLLVAGTYTGALTSSPGLGAALEATGGNPLVTVGYTIAYPFGVLAVVLFVQLAPVIFRIDVKKEREELNAIYRDFYGAGKDSPPVPESVPFSLLSFVVCVIFGILLGSVSVNVMEARSPWAARGAASSSLWPSGPWAVWVPFPCAWTRKPYPRFAVSPWPTSWPSSASWQAPR